MVGRERTHRAEFFIGLSPAMDAVASPLASLVPATVPARCSGSCDAHDTRIVRWGGPTVVGCLWGIRT
jgi:hypothetical protein